MTILELIILILFLQIIIYLLLDKFRLRIWKHVVFLLIIIGYFFVIPPYYYPKSKDGVAMCGMPAFAITFTFWLLGGIVTLFGHLLYLLATIFYSRLKKATKEK